GSLTIDHFNQYFDENIQLATVDTIAGFLIHTIGYVPDNEARVSVRLNDYVLTTNKIKKGRIYGVMLTIDRERSMDVDYVAFSEKNRSHLSEEENEESEKNEQ